MSQEDRPPTGTPGRVDSERMRILETVLDESTDPIFSILEDGTYRYVNRIFAAHFGRLPEEVIGRRIYDIFPPQEAEKRMTVVKRAFATGETIVFEVRVPMATEEDRFFLTSVKPIRNQAGQVESVVCISKDITERKRAEGEQERLILQLREALAQVKTLSGLLPICANCKKIRDDHGYWTQIEAYISEHSDAEFSHGICPECRKTFFPELPERQALKPEFLES